MTESQKIELRRSKVRERLGEIQKLSGDAYTDEVKVEERALQDEYTDLETRHRTAIIADDQALDDAKATAGDGLDAEQRQRVELRGKVRLSNFLIAAAKGRMLDGPEAELCAAAGVTGIPLELWDVPDPHAEQRAASGAEHRAVTPAPGTVGVNLDPIRPAVFATSIAARLGIDMPRVASGTYATATITTSQTGAAKPKAPAAAAAAEATAGALTVTTATPKRVSARLELTLEDIAAIGQDNFESVLRQNLALAISDELDDQVVNGDGVAPNLAGMFHRLTDPAAPGAAVASFDDFIAAFAGGVDGLWASMANQVGIVVNPETYRLSLRTFRDAAGQDLGDTSFADYAMEHFGGFWTNKRMPDKAAHIAQAILYRMGRSAMGASAGMRTAVCPHWGEVSIDDIYTGSASGTRAFTMHVLLGDVILVQPDAYAQVAYRVSV